MVMMMNSTMPKYIGHVSWGVRSRTPTRNQQGGLLTTWDGKKTCNMHRLGLFYYQEQWMMMASKGLFLKL